MPSAKHIITDAKVNERKLCAKVGLRARKLRLLGSIIKNAFKVCPCVFFWWRCGDGSAENVFD